MSSKTFPAPGDVIAVLLVTDAQQSVLAGLRSQGRATAAYTAYGFHPEQDAPGSAICYAGQRPMPDTGHYLLGNGYRAFNTVLMRFNAPDSLSPFGRGGLNAYAYCEGDPINRIDPSGHVVSLLRGIAASFLRPGQRPLARGNALRISRYPLMAVGGGRVPCLQTLLQGLWVVCWMLRGSRCLPAQEHLQWCRSLVGRLFSRG